MLKGRENTILDGQKVMLYANIGIIRDFVTVLQVRLSESVQQGWPEVESEQGTCHDRRKRL